MDPPRHCYTKHHTETPPPIYTLFDTNVETNMEREIPILDNFMYYQNTIPKPIQRKIPWELKKTRFRDPVFILSFIAVIVIFWSIAGTSFDNFNKQYNFKNIIPSRDHQRVTELHNINILQLVFLSIAGISVSLLFGLVQLISMLFICKLFIVGALVLNVIAGIAVSFHFYEEENWTYLVLTVLFTLMILGISWNIHKRVAFSNKMIKLCSRMIRENTSIWAIYLILILLHSIMFVVYFFVFYCVMSTIKLDGTTKGENATNPYNIYAFLIFSGFYLTEIFQNSIQVIVGAICAKWYFGSDVSTTCLIYNTFVKCFGAICFGSLLASTVTTLKEFFVWMKPDNKALKLSLLTPIWVIVEFILFLLDIAIRYFNEYSFAYMSIYSKGYIKSSLKLFRIYNFKGYDTLVNDCIIKVILRLYLVFAGILGALTAYFCIQQLEPAVLHSSNATVRWVLITLSTVMSVQLSRLLSLVINAHVHVLLLCLVQHRDVVESLHGEERDFRALAPYLGPRVVN